LWCSDILGSIIENYFFEQTNNESTQGYLYMRLISPFTCFLCICLQTACGQNAETSTGKPVTWNASSSEKVDITVGAERINSYVPALKNLRVGVVANQTSLVGDRHLVDTLMALQVQITKVFAPEHGFRGNAGAGETIRNGIDERTKLPVISLYGQNKKPTPEMLKDLDVLVFDIQDVGARFYTYLSTLHYVMEACAEQNKPLIVLDRPNPNGFYIDGPVLEIEYQSFVGMHPIPVVHGCTLGEMAQMINGQNWLKNGAKCQVKVVTCMNYTHKLHYQVPVSPSPNLPNMASIYLYPSLCFFEGTVVSVGRGTVLPFQSIGYPGNTTGTFAFTPVDIAHVAMNPPHEGKVCQGHQLTEFGQYHFIGAKQLYLQWLLGLYNASTSKDTFFNEPAFFDKLAGTDELRRQMQSGMDEEAIRDSWRIGLENYKLMRKSYLLYEDF
jgi:uncharacterized protein YbbC (DUF1343 family)